MGNGEIYVFSENAVLGLESVTDPESLGVPNEKSFGHIYPLARKTLTGKPG